MKVAASLGCICLLLSGAFWLYVLTAGQAELHAGLWGLVMLPHLLALGYAGLLDMFPEDGSRVLLISGRVFLGVVLMLQVGLNLLILLLWAFVLSAGLGSAGGL